jgi:hypothetical protein
VLCLYFKTYHRGWWLEQNLQASLNGNEFQDDILWKKTWEALSHCKHVESSLLRIVHPLVLPSENWLHLRPHYAILDLTFWYRFKSMQQRTLHSGISQTVELLTKAACQGFQVHIRTLQLTNFIYRYFF